MVTFYYSVGHCARRIIDRLGIVGVGNVTQTRLMPAIMLLKRHLIRHVVVCSLEKGCPLEKTFAEHYFQIGRDNLLPMGELDELGFLSANTLWIVATPSKFHVPYAMQLVGLSPVAIEKPVASDAAWARLLWSLASRGSQLYPMDHKLFNSSALEFIDACRRNASVLESVDHIEAVFYENSGIGGRAIDDCIADVVWHLLVMIVAIFKTMKRPFTIHLDRVAVATYDDNGRSGSDVWTASRILGRLGFAGGQVAFDLKQAKAAPQSEKHVRLLDGRGSLVHEVELNETGWGAYTRIIDELVKPGPDLRHCLADAIGVMEVVDEARRHAVVAEDYAFGSLPGFLLVG